MNQNKLASHDAQRPPEAVNNLPKSAQPPTSIVVAWVAFAIVLAVLLSFAVLRTSSMLNR